MVKSVSLSRLSVVLSVALAFAAVPAAVHADHSWGCYHWPSNNGITLDVGDNVSSTWDTYLDQAIADWNQSSVVQLNEVVGGSPRKNCRPTDGRIEVCNASYGNNGWLGIAQIWISGCHITQGISKLNDYYFNQPAYNTAAWRGLVMCQEIAHDFGLDHQDETFDNPNLGSCMDYTNDPDGGAGGAVNNDPSNEHPNNHDYQQLDSIYSHTDGAQAVPGATVGNEDLNSPAAWGVLVRTLAGGRVQVFERDLGNGVKFLTRVTWADPERNHRPE